MPTIVLDAFFSLHCCQFYGYKNSLQYVPFETNRANARSYDPQAGAKLARTPATQGDIRGYMLVLIARGCADGTAEGVAGAGGETPVGVARVPSWAGIQVNPHQTAVPHLPQDNLHVTVVGLEGLSTSGVYGLCLRSSSGNLFLDDGVVYHL